jgi:hypothetical protein
MGSSCTIADSVYPESKIVIRCSHALIGVFVSRAPRYMPGWLIAFIGFIAEKYLTLDINLIRKYYLPSC